MTLVELLIILVMIGLVLAASVPAMRSTLQGFRHNNSVGMVTSRMFLTRQMAVREKVPHVVTLDVANRQFSIFSDDDEDGVQDVGEDTLGPYQLDTDVRLVNVDWAGAQMTFFPNGRASQTGDLQVVDGGGRTKTIRVRSLTGNTEVLP